MKHAAGKRLVIPGGFGCRKTSVFQKCYDMICHGCSCNPLCDPLKEPAHWACSQLNTMAILKEYVDVVRNGADVDMDSSTRLEPFAL